MASSAALQILLSAKDETGPGFDTAKEKASGFGGAAHKAIGVLTGATATAALGFLSDAARGAAEDEANVLKLKQAVENSGASWDDNSAAIEARIKKGQDLAFSDTQVRDSLAILTAQTGSVEEAMKRQTLAFDLARGMGIDLEAASKLLGKVTDENVGVFKKYGITVEKGADDTAVFAAIQQKFGGQAEVYGQTTAASIFKIKDAIGEWQESLGAALGPAQTVLALLPGLSSGMTIAGGAVGGLASMVKGPMISSFLASIPATLAMMAPFLPLILIIGAIALAVGLLALAWSNNWFDIQGKTEAVVGFITGVFEGFGKFFKGMWDGLPGPVKAAIDIITAPIRGLIDIVQAAIGWLQALSNRQAQNAADAAQYDQNNPYTGPQQPGFAVGTDYVPYTGLFQLHKGEAVVPAAENRGWTGGGGESIHVEVHGSVIGIADLEARVRQAVTDGYRSGGFRGVSR